MIVTTSQLLDFPARQCQCRCRCRCRPCLTLWYSVTLITLWLCKLIVMQWWWMLHSINLENLRPMIWFDPHMWVVTTDISIGFNFQGCYSQPTEVQSTSFSALSIRILYSSTHKLSARMIWYHSGMETFPDVNRPCHSIHPSSFRAFRAC